MDTREYLALIEGAVQKLAKCFKQPDSSTSVASQQLITEVERGVSMLLYDGVTVCSAQELLQVVRKVLEFCACGEKEIQRLSAEDFRGCRGDAECVANLLGKIFKKTYSLLKVVVDRLLTDDGLQKFIKDFEPHSGGVAQQSGGVAEGLSLLVGIGSVSLHFDPAVLVLCWRTIGKLATGDLQSLFLSNDQQDVVSLLVQELSLTIATVSQQCQWEEDNMIVKKEKCVRFLASLLVRLLGQHMDKAIASMSQVTSLLLMPYPVSYYQQKRLKIHIWHEPVIEVMVKEEVAQPFFLSLFSVKCKSEGQALPWLLSVCSVVDLYPSLPASIKDWCIDKPDEQEAGTCRLLDAVFRAVDLCNKELNVPVTVPSGVIEGRPCCQVSLYEMVCSRLCGLCIHLQDHFHLHLEKCLISKVLKGEIFSGLLAADVLVFLVRCAGEEFACKFCDTLLVLSEESHSVTEEPVSLVLLRCLWTRVMSSLSVETQLNLISDLGTSTSLHICSFMNLHCLHEDVLTKLLTTVLCHLDNLTSSQLIGCIDMVLGVCSCYDYLSTAIVETCANSLLAWFNILLTDVQDNKASSPHLFRTLLYCTGHLATAISSSTLLQVLSGMLSFGLLDATDTGLAVCEVLKKTASLEFPDSLQSQVQPVFVSLYSGLLVHSHWLVQHQALSAFRKFAETSPHTAAVEDSVVGPATDLVLAFLQKLPHQGRSYSCSLANCLELLQPTTLLCSVSTLSLSSQICDCTTSDFTSTDVSGHVSVLESQCSTRMRSLMLAWQHVAMSAELLSSDDLCQLSCLVSSMNEFVSHAMSHD